MAGFVATLCLLGQLSSVAHNLLVRHATCAEHGEIIHQQDGSAPLASSTTDSANSAARGSDLGEPEDSHGHDHCLAVAHGRGHVGLNAVAAAVTADAGTSALVAVEADAHRFVSYALYRLAPKNSPPA